MAVLDAMGLLPDGQPFVHESLSGALFRVWGGPVMLYHLAALWAAFVVLATLFASDDPRARREAVALGSS